jgi:hypothetical protein
MSKYFLIFNDIQKGPFSLEELKSMNISRTTMIWYSGLAGWQSADSLPELSSLFAFAPPAAPNNTYGNANNNYSQNQAYNSPNNNSTIFTNPSIGNIPPKTWMVESILVTLFCCLPFGIAGIVNASKVETRFYAGDYDGAMRSSLEAAKWTKYGFFSSLIVGALYVIFIIAIGIGSRNF